MTSELPPSKEIPSVQNDGAQVYNNYMKELQQWSTNMKWHSWMWNQYIMMQSFSMQMMSSQHYQVPPLSGTSISSNATNHSQTQPNVQQVHLHQFELPSMKRRMVAEIIDFLILLVLKTVTLFIVMYFMGLDLDVHTDGLMSFRLVKFMTEEDMDGIANYFFDDASGENEIPLDTELSLLLAISFLYRLLTGVYEWLFVWQFASTPGKMCVGLAVVQCYSATQTSRNSVIVNPGTRVSIFNAWSRSWIKNLMIAFLVPAFLSAFYYPHKRTSYDVISNTIVVKRPRRVLRDR